MEVSVPIWRSARTAGGGRGRACADPVGEVVAWRCRGAACRTSAWWARRGCRRCGCGRRWSGSRAEAAAGVESGAGVCGGLGEVCVVAVVVGVGVFGWVAAAAVSADRDGDRVRSNGSVAGVVHAGGVRAASMSVWAISPSGLWMVVFRWSWRRRRRRRSRRAGAAGFGAGELADQDGGVVVDAKRFTGPGLDGRSVAGRLRDGRWADAARGRSTWSSRTGSHDVVAMAVMPRRRRRRGGCRRDARRGC